MCHSLLNRSVRTVCSSLELCWVAGSTQLPDHPWLQATTRYPRWKTVHFLNQASSKDLHGPCYHPEAMWLSMICAGSEIQAGDRSYAEVHGLCCHQRPCACQWSMLSPAVMGKEASFAVELMAEDSKLRTRGIDDFCDNISALPLPPPSPVQGKKKGNSQIGSHWRESLKIVVKMMNYSSLSVMASDRVRVLGSGTQEWLSFL